MPKWTTEQLILAVSANTSYRGVISDLGLKPTGGNYTAIKQKIQNLNLDKSHFKGRAWNKGLTGTTASNKIPLEDILKPGIRYQSYKLKLRLFDAGYKKPCCELCGWAEKALDGRIPVELDHINGDNTDNRIENLRILCPNCHSLQPTHRGKNIESIRASGGIGIRV